jgi:hypothetical protein
LCSKSPKDITNILKRKNNNPRTTMIINKDYNNDDNKNGKLTCNLHSPATKHTPI